MVLEGSDGSNDLLKAALNNFLMLRRITKIQTYSEVLTGFTYCVESIKSL